MELDDLGRCGIFFGEAGKGFIERDDLVWERRGWRIPTFQVDTVKLATMLGGFFSPSIFDEDAAHGLRGRGEEVTPALELLIADQTQERLVDEASRLKRLPRCLQGQFLSGEPAEFFIDKRQKLSRGARIASIDCGQNLGHFAHGRHQSIPSGRFHFFAFFAGWASSFEISCRRLS